MSGTDRSSNTLVVGVDGGNTKTLALVADLEGRVVGCGRSGNGDMYGAESPTAAMASLVEAAQKALADAGASKDSLAAGGYSIAGADFSEDYDLIASALTGYGKTVEVINDAVGALVAGAP